jgi:hypothetical protein
LKDARTVRNWVERQAEPREHDVVSRLAVLFRVVRAVESVYTPAVAAAFLRSSNPQLDDEAPLVVLATFPSTRPNKRCSQLGDCGVRPTKAEWSRFLNACDLVRSVDAESA